MYKEWFHQLCNPYPNNLPYRSHKESLLLEFFFPISFQRLGSSRVWGMGGSNCIYEWMNKKRIKLKKKIPRASVFTPILTPLSGISSFWQLQKPCRSLQVTRISGLANGILFCLSADQQGPPAPLGHHYYSPVDGLSRIWIHNFTWIVGERSKEDKILSLSLTQSTPNISNCL